MTSKKIKTKRPVNGTKLLCVMLALVTAVLLFAMLALSVTPAKYDIQLGKPAPATIKATKDVEDKITTEALRAEAEKRAGNKYSDVPNALTDVTNALEDIFTALSEIASLPGEVYEEGADAPRALTETERLERARAILGERLEIDEADLDALESADAALISEMFAESVNLARAEMSTQLKEDDVEASLSEIRKGLSEKKYPSALTDTVMSAVTRYLKANYIYDEELTKDAKQKARDAVSPVIKVKGEAITEDGKKVTEAEFEMLKTLGMIKESRIDIWLYAGLGILIISLVIAVAIYLYMFEKAVYQSPRQLLMISLICLLTILFSIISRSLNTYVMPVTLSVFMIALLINRRIALYICFPLSVIASMLTGAGDSFFNMTTYTVIISTLVSGVLVLRLLKLRQTRLQILLAGGLSAVSSVLTTLAVGLVNSTSLLNSLYTSLYSGASDVIAAILCIVLMPAFEAVFNAVTTTRLIELSNPNQPLLRRLLLEAPGTYHHSIIVANLAEAAAGEIGANPLLARVGAYYHDIGKLKRPMYFTENQLGDNPHDRTDPRVSAAIITAHPQDGVQLLKESRIPEEIKNIVLTHHGNSPVIYFYNKSLKENGEANVDDFRYKCPRPRSREEAVVMLADSVEAAARSLPNPDTDSIRALIEKLVRQKIDDSQLDECDITFRDVSRIISAFVTVLSGAFHERIEYPAVEIPKKRIEKDEAEKSAPEGGN